MKTIHSLALVLLLLAFSAASAQTTAFTYQGKLNDGGSPANATYEMQFRLFDALNGGAQVGATITNPSVSAVNGIFTVQLDFGNNFNGADRFLDIALKPAGGPNFTQLTPRQRINSAPYAVQAVNATSANTALSASDSARLGGALAAAYVQTSDPRLTDARSPLAGSGNYIQNMGGAGSPQAGANFNVGGNGTVGGSLSGGTVNAAQGYFFNGTRILFKNGTSNLFAGANAGNALATGSNNSFFGDEAGAANDDGAFNSFFGNGAGQNNQVGAFNSFFGHQAGQANTIANKNSFFGSQAGKNNAVGNNSFFGYQAGLNTTNGSSNSFFGQETGKNNTTGRQNVFFGATTGNTNTNGSNLTLIGQNADVSADGLSFATALGSGASVGSNNTVVLGRRLDSVQVPGNLTVTGTLTADLPAGSTNYIQNTNVPQALAYFNIGGDGTIGGTLSANAVNATSELRINSARVLSITGSGNVFAGAATGPNNSGSNVSFFGNGAGFSNTTGSNNSFFGRNAGLLNSIGDNNSFFGNSAGLFNTTGGNNVIVGNGAGISNTIESNNTFLGAGANGAVGLSFGTALGAGATVTTSNTVALGRNSDTVKVPGNFAVTGSSTVNQFNALGDSTVNQVSALGNVALNNNMLLLRGGNDPNQALLYSGAVDGPEFRAFGGFRWANNGGNTELMRLTADGKLGIGTANPQAPFQLQAPTMFGPASLFMGVTPCDDLVISFSAAPGTCTEWNFRGTPLQTFINGPHGGIFFTVAGVARMTIVDNVIIPSGTRLELQTLGAAGATALCRNANNEVSTCSSSLRYKKDLSPFTGSLSFINRLQPIAYRWKADNLADVGFGAEDLEKIDPRFVTYNAQGQVEGVKYDRLSTVFVNAFKEQQAQIEQQQQQIKAQQTQIELLKKLVCADHPQAEGCRQ